MNLPDLWSGIFWLIISIYILAESLRLGFGHFSRPGPGFLLFWSALVLGVLSILICIRAVIVKNGTDIKRLWVGIGWKKVIPVIGSLLLYPVFLPVIGYIVATFCLLLFLFIGIKRSRIWLSGLSSLLVTVLSYLLFNSWLGVELPKGFIGF